MSSEALEARLDDLRQVCFAPSDGYSAGEWCEAANEGVQIALALLAEVARLEQERDEKDAELWRWMNKPGGVNRKYGWIPKQEADELRAALAVAREREQRAIEALRELVEAVTTQRCNGCGAPRKAWGPTCGGMRAGDYTHFYSPEWWAKRARAALVDEPAAAEPSIRDSIHPGVAWVSTPDPAAATARYFCQDCGAAVWPAAADEPGGTP